jgi:hypothetical protein
MGIDWKYLASQVGGLEPDGTERITGTDGGRRAIELLLGEENIRDAVDCWADERVGAFTAEIVLKIIRSTVAMERCYEIYKSESNTRRAGASVFLLAEMADSRVLPWLPELLRDSSFSIRSCGLSALQMILSGPLNDEGIEAAKKLLAHAEKDADERLRERAAEIRQRLAADPSLGHLEL